MKNKKLILGLIALVITFGGVFAIVTNVVEAHSRTVKISVSKNGFSPSSIDAEAGHKLNLVFNRVDKQGCGDEVVFPSLKVRKKLPVGKDVIISFTPTASSQVNFTCGMGMMKGKIVISD